MKDIIIFWSFIISLIFLIYMFIRNIWLSYKRSYMLITDIKNYSKLPSYNKMMLKFWIWDINKFIKL